MSQEFSNSEQAPCADSGRAVSRKIALCLSGGGFRATLFHLGVVRLLQSEGRLRDVVRIDAVSGGSILAAHLALNWTAYCAGEQAPNVRLLAFVRRDVRGRIVRRYLLSLASLHTLFRKLLSLMLGHHHHARLPYRLTDLLVNEYHRFFARATMGALCTPGTPEVHFHTTSLTDGDSCAFAAHQANRAADRNTASFLLGLGKDQEFPADQVSVALAVGASSAFPPLFPPVRLEARDVGTGKIPFPRTQSLTDGGVFDNLALMRLQAQLSDQAESIDVIVSDADGGLDTSTDRTFVWQLSRNIRASNLLMHRNAVLQRDLCGLLSNSSRSAGTAGMRPHWVKICPHDHAADGVLTRMQQEAVRDFRTDLDAFAEHEVEYLMHHGEAVARSVLGAAGLVQGAAPPQSPKPRDVDIKALRRGARRGYGLWALHDLPGMAYLLLLALWLAALGWVGYGYLTRPALMLTQETWPEATQAWFNEPSGLTVTGLKRQGRPVFFGVDDEENGLFALQWIGGEQFGIIRVLRLPTKVEDLEGVAFDPITRRGFVLASHRKSSDADTMKLIQFSLAAEWESADRPLDIEEEVNLESALRDELKAKGKAVDDEEWRSKKPDPAGDVSHEQSREKRVYLPYAVEVEGVAVSGDSVFVGVKWPLLPDGRALLIELNMADGSSSGHPLDLGGLGITALARVGPALYMAANPPGKEHPSIKKGYPFGESELYRWHPTEGVRKLTTAKTRRPDAKLEGIAIHDDFVWGAFDGPGHTVAAIRCVDGADAPERNWWRQVKELVRLAPHACNPGDYE